MFTQQPTHRRTIPRRRRATLKETVQEAIEVACLAAGRIGVPALRHFDLPVAAAVARHHFRTVLPLPPEGPCCHALAAYWRYGVTASRRIWTRRPGCPEESDAAPVAA